MSSPESRKGYRVGSVPVTPVAPEPPTSPVTTAVSEEVQAEAVTVPAETPSVPAPASEAPITMSSPEGVEKWYRIVFSNELTNTIHELNASDVLSVTINADGKAYTLDRADAVKDFGKFPSVVLWGYLIPLLEEDGLFAEVRDNALFISWAG